MARVSFQLGNLAAQLRDAPAELLEACGKAAAVEIERIAAVDTGGDGELSGAPWGGTNVKVTVSPGGREGVWLGTVAPATQGDWAIYNWLENGTAPHKIGERGVGRGKKRKIIRQRLRIGENWVTGPVTVYMPAKETWSRGVDAGIKAAMRVADDVFGRTLT